MRIGQGKRALKIEVSVLLSSGTTDLLGLTIS